MANLLFEFSSSQRTGSGAFFFVVCETGRSTWYGLDAGCWAVMWTTRRCQRDGEGTTHIHTVSNKHSTTATCLLDVVFRMLAGTYLLGDQRDAGFGDIQKVDDDDNDDADDDVEDGDRGGRENREIGSG